MRAIAGALCAAALLLGGCGRDSPPPDPRARTQAEAARPAEQSSPAGRQGEVARPEAGKPEPAAIAAGANGERGTSAAAAPGEIRVGMGRTELMAALGACSERVYFAAGGPGQRAVEVFQPKKGDCRQRLGERRFTVIGDAVGQIESGTREPFAAGPPPAPTNGAKF